MRQESWWDLRSLFVISVFILIFGSVFAFYYGPKTTQKPEMKFKNPELMQHKSAAPVASVSIKIKTEQEYLAETLEGRHGDYLEFCIDQIPEKSKTLEFWKNAVKANPKVREYVPKKFAKLIP